MVVDWGRWAPVKGKIADVECFPLKPISKQTNHRKHNR
jgi:hypothetical protein